MQVFSLRCDQKNGFLTKKYTFVGSLAAKLHNRVVKAYLLSVYLSLIHRDTMQVDISAHIEKLLFLHDTLVIPNFGAFTATRSAATADYVGGVVKPPSKSLTFSENLKTDDGILVNDLATTKGVSVEDAQKAVEDFVARMQSLLDQREIVTLPGVGRLYKNYMQQIQFLPDATNFSAESFGLPQLQFSPIARSREVPEKPAETPPAATPPPVAVTPVTSTPPSPAPVHTDPVLIQKPAAATPWVTIGLITIALLLMAGLWWYKKQAKPIAVAQEKETTETPLAKNTPETEEPPAAPAETRVNAPRESGAKTTAPTKEADLEKAASASAAQKMKEARQELQKGSQSGRLCVLIVATLQDKTNAERLESRLRNAGYSVYSLRKNGYQIGIQFRYTQLTEVQQKLNELEKLTGTNDIWIKQK
jgi:cell division septation protein DedD